jgi:hypothetical protein
MELGQKNGEAKRHGHANSKKELPAGTRGRRQAAMPDWNYVGIWPKHTQMPWQNKQKAISKSIRRSKQLFESFFGI